MHKRFATLAIGLGLLCLALAACGGKQSSDISGDRPQSCVAATIPHPGYPPAFQPEADSSLDSVLAELAGLECPNDVDEALFAELKDALLEALTAKNQQLTTARFASTPPAGDANRVNDLEIADNGDGTYTLTWHYRNLGDYNQNGTVGISDITPIAIHYGEEVPDLDGEPDENSLQAVIDGSGNGTVEISDITQMAMNFGVACAGYELQQADSPLGEFTPVNPVPLAEAEPNGRLRFATGLHLVSRPYLRVVPYDAQDALGVPSDSVVYDGEPPRIVSVSPTTGLEGASVQFSFEITGTLPSSYAWNFGGGADPDASSQSNPLVTLGAVGEYSASLAVSNSFGADEFPFTLTVNPAPPEISGVSPTNGLEGSSVQFSAVVTGTAPLSYDWSFDGGAVPDTSGEVAPTVTLGNPGEYSASLTVTNAVGEDVFPFTLTVDPGFPPEIISVEPLAGEATEPVTFTAQVNGTTPFAYVWDFGGAVSDADTNSSAPSGAWSDVGVYESCSLAVSNDFGEDTFEFTLTVSEHIPDWHVVLVDEAGVVGLLTSVAAVNGRPAISYYDYGYENLKYVRALDARGNAWSEPVVVDETGDVGSFTGLAVVNGHPAISYTDWTAEDLKYVRALDADGAEWGEPVTVDYDGRVGRFTGIAIINGNPGISYRSDTEGDLKFARASDANGAEWATPVTVDSAGNVGYCTSLASVNGRPAISYRDGGNKDLRYVRANNADGTSWGGPVTLDEAGDVGQFTSLDIVDGYPAISYRDATNGDLKFVRAKDASGGDWNTPISVDGADDVGEYTSLEVIGGAPAICYYDLTNGDLKYVEAVAADGSVWGSPLVVDSAGDVGTWARIASIDGCPIISYHDEDNTDLKFAIRY